MYKRQAQTYDVFGKDSDVALAEEVTVTYHKADADENTIAYYALSGDCLLYTSRRVMWYNERDDTLKGVPAMLDIFEILGPVMICLLYTSLKKEKGPLGLSFFALIYLWPNGQR